jgi:hypothetical protein
MAKLKIKPPANLRTKEDWIRMYPYLFPSAVLYDKKGKRVKLK